MAKDFQAIVLSVGIAAGAPFTLNRIPKIGLVSPPTLVDSITAETAAGDWTVGTDPSPAATETIRWQGGFISDTGAGHDNLIGGRGAVASLFANARNVVLGTLARADASGGGFDANVSLNVVIGFNAALNQGVGSCVVIGSNFIMGAGFPGGNLVAIGDSVNVDQAFTGPGIGQAFVGRGRGCGLGNTGGATGNFNNWTTLGFNARAGANNVTVLGDGAIAAFATSIVVGRNAQAFAANQFVAGGQNLAISSVLFGGGDTAVGGVTVTYRHTNGSGNDDPAASAIWQAPLGTGNAIGGGFELRVGVAGASGAALQPATVALRVEGGTRNIACWGAGSFGSGVGVMFLANAGTVPSANPAGGGILYVTAGALTYRGSGGTVTTVAPA
jgi:hypothetical protein